MSENRKQIIAAIEKITGCGDENLIDFVVDRIIREIEEKLEPYHSEGFTHGRLVRR